LGQLVATFELSDDIAIVGCMLLYPNGTVQHSGVILGLNHLVGHAHKYLDYREPGYMGRLHCLQEFSAVTCALAAVKRSSFLSIGGFDAQRYPGLYNDVDMCLRLRLAGYRCIYNPSVKAIHHESATRQISSAQFVYQRRLVEQYGHLLCSDPFYNPNLALDNEQFSGCRAFPVTEQIPDLSAVSTW